MRERETITVYLMQVVLLISSLIEDEFESKFCYIALICWVVFYRNFTLLFSCLLFLTNK